MLKTGCDVQGFGKFVVGPGSLHQSGRRYEVVDDVPIAFIKRSELDAVLMQFGKKPEIQQPRSITARSQTILGLVTLRDVMEHFGFDTRSHATDCKMHQSASGTSFCWDDAKGVWFCHGCQKGGNAITLMRHMGGSI